MSQVKNPFSNVLMTKNSTIHDRVKYLKSLRKLNTTKIKIKNPNQGRSILVLGPSHIKYLYNNFSLNQQNKLIENFKKELERETELKGFQEDYEDVEKTSENMNKKAKNLFSKIYHKIEKTQLKVLKKSAKEADRKRIKDVKQVKNLTSQINYKIREREIKHLREEQEMKTWKLKQQHQRDQELFDIMDYLVRKREGIEEMTREMKAKLSMRAFSGSYQSFFLIPKKSNKYSYPKFFDDAKSEIKRIIKLKLNELRGVKFKLSYLGLFRYGVGLDERHEAKNFHSKV